QLRSISVRDLNTSSKREIALDNLLVRVGVEPNSGLVKGIADLDDRGYIEVDRLCRTSHPKVFAVGDVSNPISPTLASATGSAAAAAKAIYSLIYKRPHL
ncbi:MAG TPA: FAD-dependent oxidoreductase, partial [Pyrinomonadaceae bacterium]|nr:FAD-dependent oxidoreductase [Pyrinomonadaceae bacterium]